MIILDENYFIEADECQYILRKRILNKSKKTREEKEWHKPIGYYKRLNTALLAYSDELDRDIVQSGSMSLTDALKVIVDSREQVKRMIREALPEVSE